MSREVIIRLSNNKNEMPIYLNIDTTKSSTIYTSLCSLRNKLIESGIGHIHTRFNMYFYKKINKELIKLKENEILDGCIYLINKQEIDYSEPVNILFNLEKRITIFENEIKELNNRVDISKYDKYINLKKIWNNFKDLNSDCFDYNEWYFMNMLDNDLLLLSKISLDIKKWLCQKEKFISELDIEYLDTIVIKYNDDDYNQISKYII